MYLNFISFIFCLPLFEYKLHEERNFFSVLFTAVSPTPRRVPYLLVLGAVTFNMLKNNELGLETQERQQHINKKT